MSYVYIIRSREGLISVGSTTDIPKRLYQHNNKLTGWTKRGNEWEIIHLEEFNTYSEPRKERVGIKLV